MFRPTLQAFCTYLMAFVLLIMISGLLFACMRANKPSAPQHVCDPEAARDTRALLGRFQTLREYRRTAIQVNYWGKSPSSLFYLTYYPRDGTCMLGHLDARWVHHSVPQVFALRGGGLRSITLSTSDQGAQITVVDRWGRRMAQTLKEFPGGLTLWGDDGPLHAAVGGAWKTEAGPDIGVSKNGPTLFSVYLGKPYPPEWDLSAQRYVRAPSVYIPKENQTPPRNNTPNH